MGGRGTFASGVDAKLKWQTVGFINGVKVLEQIDKTKSMKLPEESHSSDQYILLGKDGKFYQYREYDKNHYLKFEIGYDFEKKLAKKGKILHVHEYSRDMKKRTTRYLTYNEFKKYKNLFNGVDLRWKV